MRQGKNLQKSCRRPISPAAKAMRKATMDRIGHPNYRLCATSEDKTMASKYYGILAICVLPAGILGCDRQVSFANDVQPIFREHCIECHNGSGEGSHQSGLDLGNYESVMGGTEFGPVVVPESSMSSALYLVSAQKTAPEIQMPPHHQQALAEGRGDALPEGDVEIVRAWIDQGAKNN
jgi:hypothetical protein